MKSPAWPQRPEDSALAAELFLIAATAVAHGVRGVYDSSMVASWLWDYERLPVFNGKRVFAVPVASAAEIRRAKIQLNELSMEIAYAVRDGLVSPASARRLVGEVAEQITLVAGALVAQQYLEGACIALYVCEDCTRETLDFDTELILRAILQFLG